MPPSPPPLASGQQGGSDHPPAGRGSAAATSTKQPGQPLKRACDQCNLRRVKCSHEHPCAHCVRLRITCTYWKAARGKESSGKRIEKLRRDQALAAAAAAAAQGVPSSSSAQGTAAVAGGASAYPLGSFSPLSDPSAYPSQTAKLEVGSGLPPPPSAQYAGPSAHFPPPAPPPPASGSTGPDGGNRNDPRLSLGASSHQQNTPASTTQPSFSRPLDAYAPQQHSPDQSRQQPHQGAGNGTGQQTHVPTAVFLGNAFFPPSLTTVSPSMAANFRLPDLSTSLADEFNAQDPNVRANNFFDWGMGMLGAGGGPGPGAQPGSAGVQYQPRAAAQAGGAPMGQPHSLHSSGISLNQPHHHLGPNPADSLGMGVHPPQQAQYNFTSGAGGGAQPNGAQNARMNLYDWGLGMLASGVDGAGLSPHTSGGGGSNSLSGSVTGSPAANLAGSTGALNGLYPGGSTPATTSGATEQGRAASGVAFRDHGGNDFALGLQQQQQQQRLAQERHMMQQQQQQQQASPFATSQRPHMVGPIPVSAAPGGTQAAAAAAAVTPGLPLPPSMQGVLPSTLEILSGAHPLSESVLVPHIALYFERLHPIMPVFSRSWIFGKLDNGEQHTSVDFAAMLLAMCALALIQPQEAKERATARMRVRQAKALLEESVRLRNAVLFGKDPTLESTMTSFYVFACLFGLGEDNPAWFRLHEAVALGLLLKLHEPKAYANLQRDEQERRLRAYWLLVITERAYSLQRGHSLGFRGHPERTTRTLRRQFGLEELEDFPHLQLKLFDAVDEDFVDCWNGRCEAASAGSGERCSRMDRERALKLWATFQQSEKEINEEVLAAEVAARTKKTVSGLSLSSSTADGGGGGGAEASSSSGSSSSRANTPATAAARRPGSNSRSEDERQAEFERQKIQLADHRITAQWLLNRLWNLCLTHGHVDLSPSSLTSSSTSSSSSSAVVVPPPFRLDAALRIARKMLAICHELSQSSMEAHGIGLMEKLYDVAMTLVMICRDFPALAKRIGLVDLNLKRGGGAAGGRRARERDEGGGGGAGSQDGGAGRRRIANGGGAYGQEVYEVDQDEGEDVGGDYSRPAALSPSVPGFFYPLPDEPATTARGGGERPALRQQRSSANTEASTTSSASATSTLAHPHLSMGAVMQQIPQEAHGGAGAGASSTVTVKREGYPDGGDTTLGQSQNRSRLSRPPPRALRQAPTAIESILQEYVEIFHAFRAGDHPFLEKMVVAMKELVQGLPSRGAAGAGAGGGPGNSGGSNTAMPSPVVPPASGFGGPVGMGGKRLIHPLPSHLSGSGNHAGSSTGTGGGGAFSTPAPPHPASLSGGDAASAAAAMQRASAYAFTPPASASASANGDGGAGTRGSSTGGGSVAAASSVDSMVAVAGTPSYHGSSGLNNSGGAGPGSVESFLGASPGGASVQSFGGGVSNAGYPHHQQQGPLSNASGGGRGAPMFHPGMAPGGHHQQHGGHQQHVASPAMSSPSLVFVGTPSAGVGGVAPSPRGGGGVTTAGGGSGATPGAGGPGMEWSQMPEDLGWPSFESFLRECGLWDSVGQQQQHQHQQHQQHHQHHPGQSHATAGST
ncbi:hypothetical protein V8E36_009388 [Tilletia maclaganii]